MSKLKHISHLYKDSLSGEWIIQSNSDHCEGVAILASEFAKDFGMEGWGYLLGLLHDKGKESFAFQAHIKRESGYDVNARVEGTCNHAFVGAVLAKNLFRREFPLIANPIAGHHRGLYDMDELKEVLENELPEGIENNLDYNHIECVVPRIKSNQDVSHIIRMLFSCLVDADYLDTERFMDKSSFQSRRNGYNLKDLLYLLERHLERLAKKSVVNPVNDVRKKVQDICRHHKGGCDIYEMTVPTGGGKTLSSILWALRHAIDNDLKRIIIAIPYTSIIEQTAGVLRSIFGSENVLEHHSQVSFKEICESDLTDKMKLATENWDYPIVVTTNVRLFESMFGHKPGACRRLHNMSRSVLIFDEIQTLPIPYYSVILQGLETYNRIFGSTVLMTTASQPPFSGVITGCNPFVKCPGLEKSPVPIVPHDAKMWLPLKRVSLHFEIERFSYDELAQRLASYPRVLCIVNTRKTAQQVYIRIPKRESLIHLSRLMCPAHIKERLELIRRRLENPVEDVRVISTQLIEAGVDVDFPVVFRQEAGLDSIVQASGRCNREGKLKDLGKTYVFGFTENGTMPPGFISKGNNARLDMPSEIDWFSDAAMKDYFKRLYCKIDSFDADNTYEDLKMGSLKFETASRNFKYIDDNSIQVVVNWRDADKIIEKYKAHGTSYRLMKELGQYSVSLSKHDFKVLMEAGSVQEVGNIYFLSDPLAYDNEIGVKVDNHWLNENIII
jgi:CRISPR-associated helicase cas3